MKKNALLLTLLIPLLLTNCKPKTEPNNERWLLQWAEEFDQTDHFDTTRWSVVPRANPDWKNLMTDFDSCYAMRDGNLVLRGIVNTTQKNDTATYLTGGIWTKDKVHFSNGRVEVRAKVGEGIGAWPAIWMLPKDSQWPFKGEIDIMEHLNHDTIVYQTVHSNYTHHLGIKDNPQAGATHTIKNNEYNLYAVEMYPDSLAFFVNDKFTFGYPRIETDKEGQFPFNDQPFYFIISMQLGGSWVGKVDPKDLPLEMYVDWVRFYKENPDHKKTID